MEDMYRLLAIAKYEDRYVIPAGHAESAHDLEGTGTDCPLNAPGGPGMGMSLPEESLGMSGPGYATKRQESHTPGLTSPATRSEEHTSELQSRGQLVCRLLLEQKKTHTTTVRHRILIVTSDERELL